MTVGSRSKGREFQSRIARWLRISLELGSYWSTQGMESGRGNIGDVRLEKSGAPQNEGYLVQTKKGKQPSPWKAMAEAEEAAEDTRCLPVAVVHRDQRKPGQGAERLVIMRPEHWAILARAAAYVENQSPREIEDLLKGVMNAGY